MKNSKHKIQKSPMYKLKQNSLVKNPMFFKSTSILTTFRCIRMLSCLIVILLEECINGVDSFQGQELVHSNSCYIKINYFLFQSAWAVILIPWTFPNNRPPQLRTVWEKMLYITNFAKVNWALLNSGCHSLLNLDHSFTLWNNSGHIPSGKSVFSLG